MKRQWFQPDPLKVLVTDRVVVGHLHSQRRQMIGLYRGRDLRCCQAGEHRPRASACAGADGCCPRSVRQWAMPTAAMVRTARDHVGGVVHRSAAIVVVYSTEDL